MTEATPPEATPSEATAQEATARVALITGAGSGIGAATAQLPAARGMRVVVNYLHSAAVAEKVVSDIEAAGGQAMAVQADVREPAAVEDLVTRVRAAWGGIDVLVHNALTPYVIKPFQEMTWDELGGKVDDEMRAALVVTKAVLPGMIDRSTRPPRCSASGSGSAWSPCPTRSSPRCRPSARGRPRRSTP